MLFFRFRIIGHSMEPTIKNGHRVLVSDLPYVISNPRIGDVVLFRTAGKNFVKRIKKIEKEKYYLIGDNKRDSLDSRKIGWINRKQILGKVLK